MDANLPEDMLIHIVSRLEDGFVIANAVSNAKAPRLRAVLKGLDCLTLNRSEAATLLDMPGQSGCEQLAGALIDSGLRSFVLTDGGNELLAYSGKRLDRLTPPRSEIVDVTGAGDALTAGTIAAIARGHDLHSAVRHGLGASALTLHNTGALAGGLSWDRLVEFNQKFDQSDKT